MKKLTVFDHCTIFPPSKIQYKSPWAFNNLTNFIWKFMFDDMPIYCKDIDTIPRIIDQNYNTIIFSLLEFGQLPDELTHVKRVENPKIGKNIFQKLFGVNKYSENKVEIDRMKRDGVPDDIILLMLSSLEESKLMADAGQKLRIKTALQPIGYNPFIINVLCCDFEIKERLGEKYYTNQKDNGKDRGEGMLNLGYRIKKGDDTIRFDKIQFNDNYILPDFPVLCEFAMKKLRTFEPNQIGLFFTYHCEKSHWSTYEFIELSNEMADKLYFSYTDTSKNIEYRIAFKNWLTDTIKSKQLNYQKFSDSVKEKIKTSQPEPKQITTPELIKLNYGANNEKIIQLLHVELNGIFIENIDFKDFERHFKDNGAELKKMQWKGIETEITYLINELKLENRYKLIMIVNHFYDQTNNKDFKNKQLSTVLSQDVDTRKMKSNPIYKILNSINLEVSKVST